MVARDPAVFNGRLRGGPRRSLAGKGYSARGARERAPRFRGMGDRAVARALAGEDCAAKVLPPGGWV
jgi:hypothetical protein